MTGAAEAQEANRDKPKTDRDNRPPSEDQEAQSPSGSKKQSDSQGENSGNKSGGGKKGPGQSANAAGNDSAGSNSAADQGAGAAKEKGMGETGTKAGNQEKSDKPTGESSEDQPGQGTKTQRDPSGDKPPQNESPPKNDQRDPQDNATPPENAKPMGKSEGEARGKTNTPPIGGGKASDNDNEPPPSQGGEAPEAEKAKIDYAREATDLVIDYLKDQKDRPDQELLDELNWTKDDLEKFLARWQEAKREAATDPQQKSELDEALRSLGLRPQGDKLRSAEAKSDDRRGLGDVGPTGGPPAKYQKQFNAFKKGAARGK
jgi:hypothetical protein